MKSSLAARLVATAVSTAMVATPVLAEKANRLSDLVGTSAAGGQTALESRGFAYVSGKEEGTTKVSWYWHARDKNCIRVETSDGRFSAISDASDADCGHKSSGSGAVATAAVIGAVALGAILLSRKSKNSNSGYQQDWQQVEVHGLQSGSLRIFAKPSKNARVRGEVGAGAILRNYGCDSYEGETWCEVDTMDGRTRGWARDRYLRPAEGGGYYPPGSGGGWSGSGDLVEVQGLQSGMLTINSGPSKSDPVVGRVRAGTQLYRMGCQSAGGENWCQVATVDRRMHGWTRERYLRSVSGGGGYYPPSGGGTRPAEYRDLVGSRAASALDEMARRGFQQVDSFQSGYNGSGTVWYHRAANQCVQVITVDGRVDSAVEIQHHPRCR